MLRVTLLLLIGAVAMTTASTGVSHCCSAGDRAVVQKEWKALVANQDVKFRAGIARLLLLRVLEDFPDDKVLFKNVDIDNPKGGVFSAHAIRIFNALDMVINLLDDTDALEEALDHLADQHAARAGVKKEHFVAFGQAMNRGLPKILDHYDLTSWKLCMRGVLEKISSKLHE